MAEPAEETQAVVDGDHHDILPAGQPIGGECGGGTDRVPTPMYPYHDRQRTVRVAGRPDIQVEAILGAHHLAGFTLHPGEHVPHLHTGWAKAQRVKRRIPGCGGLGRPPAPLSGRCGREGDAQPGIGVVGVCTAHHRPIAGIPETGGLGDANHFGCLGFRAQQDQGNCAENDDEQQEAYPGHGSLRVGACAESYPMRPDPTRGFIRAPAPPLVPRGWRLCRRA